MTDFRDRPIFVTGGSGQFGRLVTAELLARGATNVTAGTRDPSKIDDPRLRAARIDFDDPASLDAAFGGVERLLIVSTDALDGAGTRLRQHLAAVAAAKRSGVGHIVYTSMPTPAPDHPIFFAPDHLGTETAIRDSGTPYTILRNNWYFENTLMGIPAAIASGALYTSAGSGGLAHVAREDLAAAAAGALLSEKGSAIYELSGPAAMTIDAQVAVFNEVLGTNIRVVHLDDETLRAGLTQAGLPEGLIALVVGADRAIREGRMGQVTDHVERLSGRTPQPFADWVRANAGLFKPAMAAA
jgi:NAD(P)H dehydrogenase (quinone)